jgi:hypothetical protein
VAARPGSDEAEADSQALGGDLKVEQEVAAGAEEDLQGTEEAGAKPLRVKPEASGKKAARSAAEAAGGERGGRIEEEGRERQPDPASGEAAVVEGEEQEEAGAANLR